MSAYEQISDLPMTIESVERRRYTEKTTSGFDRTTTEFRLAGDGVIGRGEDVTYETEDHAALVGTDPIDVEGEWTIDELSARLDEIDLFAHKPPEQAYFRNYRRWAVESAALDLAPPPARESLGECLGREPEPVRFVVSTRLGSHRRRTASRNCSRSTTSWSSSSIRRPTGRKKRSQPLETGAVRILDLKGWYEGTDVDVEADPELYRDVFAAFPAEIVEDAAFTPETRPLVEPQADRLSFDYPIDGVESLESLPVEPGWCNIKPSRFGTRIAVRDDSVLRGARHRTVRRRPVRTRQWADRDPDARRALLPRRAERRGSPRVQRPRVVAAVPDEPDQARSRRRRLRVLGGRRTNLRDTLATARVL